MTAEAFTEQQMGGEREPFLSIFIPGEPYPKGSLTPITQGTRLVYDKRLKRMGKKPIIRMLPAHDKLRKDGTRGDARKRAEIWTLHVTTAFNVWQLTHKRVPGDDEAIRAELVFVLPRPPSRKKAKYPNRKPDLDKLARCVYDCAVRAKVLGEDSRIVKQQHEKIFPIELVYPQYNPDTAFLPTGVHVKLWVL